MKNSSGKDLMLSLLFMLGGAGLGLQLGGRLADWMDGGSKSTYWDLRLGVGGILLGLIGGAVAAYFYDRSRKS